MAFYCKKVEMHELPKRLTIGRDKRSVTHAVSIDDLRKSVESDTSSGYICEICGSRDYESLFHTFDHDDHSERFWPLARNSRTDYRAVCDKCCSKIWPEKDAKEAKKVEESCKDVKVNEEANLDLSKIVLKKPVRIGETRIDKICDFDEIRKLKIKSREYYCECCHSKDSGVFGTYSSDETNRKNHWKVILIGNGIGLRAICSDCLAKVEMEYELMRIKSEKEPKQFYEVFNEAGSYRKMFSSHEKVIEYISNSLKAVGDSSSIGFTINKLAVD